MRKLYLTPYLLIWFLFLIVFSPIWYLVFLPILILKRMSSPFYGFYWSEVPSIWRPWLYAWIDVFNRDKREEE